MLYVNVKHTGLFALTEHALEIQSLSLELITSETLMKNKILLLKVLRQTVNFK
jgi:hypothetical protein